MTELKPSHCWIKRTLFLKGHDSEISNQVIHFPDPADDSSLAKIFVDVLIEFGKELDLHEIEPHRMDVGRYVIESEKGFSVIEIDPAWTEEQIEQMEAMDSSPQIDMKVWGDIFHNGQAA